MCSHLTRLTKRREPVTPSARGCEECLASGDGWVELRLCLTCGHVGCCDNSPNRHATRHYHATEHPVIASYEPDAGWAWCYPHEEMVESFPALPGERPAKHYAPPRSSR